MWRVLLNVMIGLVMASGSWAAGMGQDGESGMSGAGRVKGSRQQVDGTGVAKGAMTIRVATFNIEDIRTDDLKNPDHPRLARIAAIIQRLRPTVILINEIAYDEPGSPGFVEGDEPGLNGQRLIENFLNVAQADGLPPMRYRAFMAPSNTGRHSGFDLNNDGEIATVLPDVPAAASDGSPGKQTDAGRVYGNDCWGFGTFPGQYGMVLLVDERLEIVGDEVRTFGKLAWDAMPRALIPVDEAGEPWYDDEERSYFRLSSKSHWDVPVRLPNGAVVHFLASHPTPPAFDGDEQRNVKRNHDEIRFWADYIGGAEYIIDDAGRQRALGRGARFVILGDLNADPDEGASLDDPVGRFLLRNRAVQGEHVPRGAVEGDLDDDDTARWGLRVDYVLPSVGMEIVGSGIWRAEGKEDVSDHFPVWIEVVVPGG